MTESTTDGRCLSCGNFTIVGAGGMCRVCAENPQSRPDAYEDDSPPPNRKTYVVAVPDPDNETAVAVAEQCQQIARRLIEKNRQYGNSVLSPLRLFSTADAVEQIRVRIDDKLSRIFSAQIDDDEDAVFDLIGYLIYLRIAKSFQNNAAN